MGFDISKNRFRVEGFRVRHLKSGFRVEEFRVRYLKSGFRVEGV